MKGTPGNKFLVMVLLMIALGHIQIVSQQLSMSYIPAIYTATAGCGNHITSGLKIHICHQCLTTFGPMGQSHSSDIVLHSSVSFLVKLEHH